MSEARNVSPPNAQARNAGPLRALLLRVGTNEHVALSEVLDVNAAQNAVAARQALGGFAADVVVADVGATEREAMALLAYLRDPVETPRRGLPFICLLAESSPERVRRLIKSGVGQVMIKRISVSGLCELAQYLCDNPMPQVSVPKYIGSDRRRLPMDSYTGPTRRQGE